MCFFGDSIVVGVGDVTTLGWVGRVVVAFGVNDTVLDDGQRRVPESDTVTAMEIIADQAQAAAWPLLIVGPTLIEDPAQAQRILALSAAMAGRCADRGLPCVAIAPRLDDDEWLAEVSSRDGAHPGYRGYERLSSAI